MTTDKHTKTDTGAAPGNLGVWFEVYVEDMARARHFYQTLFRIELEELPNLGEDDMQLLAFPYADNTPGIGGALVRHQVQKVGRDAVAQLGRQAQLRDAPGDAFGPARASTSPRQISGIRATDRPVPSPSSTEPDPNSPSAPQSFPVIPQVVAPAAFARLACPPKRAPRSASSSFPTPPSPPPPPAASAAPA